MQKGWWQKGTKVGWITKTTMTQFGIGASLFEIKGCKGFKGLKNNGLPGVEGIDILCNFNKPRIASHGASLFFGVELTHSKEA